MNRYVLPLIRVAVAALVCASTSAQEPARSTLRGRITDTAGSPLRRAVVALATGLTTVAQVATDDEGRFEFVDIRPGRYSLAASKAGFATIPYRDSGQANAEVFDVRSGELREGLEMQLPPGAAFVVTVTGVDGLPIRGLKPQVYRSAAGALVPVATTARTTDERGEIRMGGLAAGRYYLAVTRGPESILFYYPAGTPLLADAAAIAIAEAEEVNVSFVLKR